MGREGEAMVVDQTGEEGVVMVVDQMEGEATATDQTEGEAMAVDQTAMVIDLMVRTDQTATGVAEQREVMATNLLSEVMEADLIVEDMVADLKVEGTTVNLEVMAADQREVMAADLEEVKQGRMVLVEAGEDFKAIKVEEERGLEVFRKEIIKTEVEEVMNARTLVRGVLVQQVDLLEEFLRPLDMTDKGLVIDRVLGLVVDTILGDHLHLLQGVMIDELHHQ